MRDAHPTERAYGVDYYASDADGIGGRLREGPEEFRVREIEGIEPEPLSADPDAYPHLVVRATLSDWDTNEFARELADRLRISRERVSWAGTKDKRAHTTQLFSVDGLAPGDLPAIRDAEMEPIGRFGRRLLFGDLAGNEFEVTVADPERPDGVDAITEDLRAFGGDIDDRDDTLDGAPVGVPNYFGGQRFGSRRPVTHAVGLRIIREDWRGAVMAYVGDPHEAEPEDTRAARRYVEETGDWAGALERMPRRMRHERAMLHALSGSAGEPEDFRAAIEAVPSALQRMFVHAAQSFVFNRVLSIRLERGLPFDRAVPGDVVCFAEEIGGLTVPDTDRLQRVTEGRVETVNRHVERGRAFVTAPLVGTDTDLGGGEQGEIERAVLADLDIALGDFDLPGEFGSSGTRRAILVRTGVEVAYDPLRFSFALPKGSYATVLMREYLKTSPTEL